MQCRGSKIYKWKWCGKYNARRIFVPKRYEITRACKNCIMRSFMACTQLTVNEMGRARNTSGVEEERK
jgi:hypothetical protein